MKEHRDTGVLTLLSDISKHLDMFYEFSEALLAAATVELNGAYESSSVLSCPDRIDVRLQLQCLVDRGSASIRPINVSVILYDVSRIAIEVTRDPAQCLLIDCVKITRSNATNKLHMDILVSFDQSPTDCDDLCGNSIRISFSSIRFCW